MNKEFNIIWIDDEYDKMSAFQEECKIIHHINLFPFRTQKSGMEALDNNLDKWDGVLLDAKMFDADENEAPRLVGLKNAIAHINQLTLRKKIPYFISTGQPDLMDNDVFEESYGQYYIKERDDEKLISDMKDVMSNSPRQQLLSMYSDVVTQMNDMDPRGTDIIVKILEAFHFPAEHTDFDPLLHYTRLRLLLEYLFRACNKYEIIPSVCFAKDNVNLNQCYNYLRGKPAMVVKVRFGEEGDRIVPDHIEGIIKSILYFGNINSHTTSLSDEDKVIIENLLSTSVVSSKYMIFGLTLQMCEAISWFGKYIKNNKDIDKNKSRCKEWNNPIENISGVLEIVNENPTISCVGTDYCISTKAAKARKAIGKMVRIIDYEVNKNEDTSQSYKYYIKKLEVEDNI